MKTSKILCPLVIVVVLIGCQPASEPTDDGAMAVFEKNTKTVQATLEAWQNENLDYSQYYADNFQSWPTAHGATDTLSLEQMAAMDQQNWDRYDFEMLNAPFNFLPGVDVESKKPDGSVRYYGNWKVTLPATDSTDARSGIIRIYSAFVFNDQGKITLQLTYGDFGGLLYNLNSN